MTYRWQAIKNASKSLASVFGARPWEPSDLARDRDGDIIQTERAVSILCMLASAALSLLLIIGIVRSLLGHFALGQFILWSCLTALAAWLVGAILGLLFGLPSVREVRLSDPSDSRTHAGASLAATGYQESTNLEQVADWVTKILIGLTLTQYALWEQAFERAFRQSSALMLDERHAGPAAATIIALVFAANGFLIVYLSMRRYFIVEMVAGRGESWGKLRRDFQRLEEAGLVQKTSVTVAPAQQETAARSIAETAVRLSPTESVGAAREIANQNSDFPDDPWRGKFGGQPSGGGCQLSATVAPLDNLNQFFTVKLILRSETTTARLGQSATFYLHPTFGPDPKKIAFGTDGVATLELIAFGAFTVGVLLEDGTKLELNLATLSDAPEAFRQR
jgi:hypothetical protein